MANAMYPTAKAAFLGADIDLLVDDIRWIIIDSADYTYSSAHQFLTSVPGAARVAVSGALAGKSTTGGVFDANDITITAVTGDVSEALILYRHTGSDATAALILFLDTVTSGLPLTPNGGDVNINHDNGANKIFAITG